MPTTKSGFKSGHIIGLLILFSVIFLLAYYLSQNYKISKIITDTTNAQNEQNETKENFHNMFPHYYTGRPNYYPRQSIYPNLNLNPQVIGCGGRRQGCLGGSQIGIPNVDPPIEISNNNIAPVNIYPRSTSIYPRSTGIYPRSTGIYPRSTGIYPKYSNQMTQVGIIQKVFGRENQVYPLYGYQDPRNNRWKYFTVLGPSEVYVPIITQSYNEELGTNDQVRIVGNTGKYRATIYEKRYPQYVPYIH